MQRSSKDVKLTTMSNLHLVDAAEPNLAQLRLQPPLATCECQSCTSDEHDSDAQCNAPANYLIEAAGFSCIDCLPMMVEIGLAMLNEGGDPDLEDSDEPPDIEPSRPVRVANYVPGEPMFAPIS